MHLTKSAAAIAATIVVGATSLVAVPAAQASNYCDPEAYYTISSKTAYHIGSGPTFKDGRGGTVTAHVQTSATVSATGSVSAGASIGGVVAQAKIDISKSVTRSVDITVGHTYTHNIASDKYGNMRYGSWGYKVNWKYKYIYSNCTTVTKASGTAKVPTNSVGWKYWQTSS